MLTIRIFNLPTLVFNIRYLTLDKNQIKLLRQKIAISAGCSPEVVELRLEKSEEYFLEDSGFLTEDPVRIVVDSFPGRTTPVKQQISNLLLEFFRYLRLDEGLRISFIDGSAGSYFIEKNGKMVLVKGGKSPDYR